MMQSEPRFQPRQGRPQPSEEGCSRGVIQPSENAVVAHGRTHDCAKSVPNDTVLCHSDPSLAVVVGAWPTLPDALKSGILAMVRAASFGAA